MRRTVKAWVVVNKRGYVPFHDPVQRANGPVGRKRCDVEDWGNQAGDVIVRGTITYDDGRPAPRKRTASMPAYKRAYIDACLSPRKRPARKGRGGRRV